MTTGSDRRGGACVSWFAAAAFWQHKNGAVELPQGIICSNVERKNKFKRFKKAVGKFFYCCIAPSDHKTPAGGRWCC